MPEANEADRRADEGDEERRKQRAAEVREEIERLRAGRVGPPRTPRDFVDRQTADQGEDPGEPQDAE
jgi:hypothetical protein